MSDSLPPIDAPRPETSGKRAGGVQSLDRAFALLEIMAEAGGEASLSQLADASGLPLPTIHRIIRTLVATATCASCPPGATRSARG